MAHRRDLTVLAVSGAGDRHVEAVEHQLGLLGVSYLAMCPDEVVALGVSCAVDGQALLEVPEGDTWRIGPHTTVWWRRPALAHPPGWGDAAEQRLYADETAAILVGMLLATGVRWVDHPARQWIAGHKLYQLATAASMGIATPRTLVTNQPAAASAWAAGLGTRTLAKPASSGHGIAPLVDLIYPEDISLLIHQPTLLQEALPASADVRVVTIGDAAYCWTRARRVEEPIDWRGVDPLGVGFEPDHLPELADMATGVAAALRLEFSVQDWLVLGQGHPPVFLEVNTQGAWLFLSGSNDRIAPRLAAHLARPVLKADQGEWPKWWRRLLWDLTPARWARAKDGLRAPVFSQPGWQTSGRLVTQDMVEDAAARRAEAEARAASAEVRAGKIGQLAMTLLALAFAVGTYTAKRVQELDLSARWWVLIAPAVGAVISLALAALQGLNAEHSVRLTGAGVPAGIHSPSAAERRRAAEKAAYQGERVAHWSATKKLSESLQARAWLTRGVVLLIWTGLVAAWLLVI